MLGNVEAHPNFIANMEITVSLLLAWQKNEYVWIIHESPNNCRSDQLQTTKRAVI